MLEHLPKATMSQFLDKPIYLDNGIKMLHDLCDQLNPSKPEHRLADIRKLTQLEQGVNESADDFMARARHISTRLGSITMAEVLPLFALLGMDHQKYDGLLLRYTSGNPSIIAADLPQLERQMKDEDARKEAMGITIPPPSSIKRASGQAPPKPTETTKPPGPPHRPPPDREEQIYPPPGGIKWYKLAELIKGKEKCPHCFSEDPFHLEEGCPALAKSGLICVLDAAKAAAIYNKYDALHPRTPGTGRGGGRGSGRGGAGRGGTGGRGGDSNSSVRRATSSEREKPSPAPPPPPPNPSPPVTDAAAPSRASSTAASNQYSAFRDENEIPSDSDDDDGFLLDYGNNVDDKGNIVSDNLNTESNVYTAPSSFVHYTALPFGGPTFNKVAHKWSRKLSNRRRRRDASARQASARPTSSLLAQLSTPAATAATPSSSIGQFAEHQLASPDACIFTYVGNDDDCCADSGATDVMLPDYGAFVSYHKCHNRVAVLGDDTELPILGEGSAKFSLNGKIILIRNVLHVPGLRSPLYSLRKHKAMPGCGTFSFHNVGSFVLFPNFTLRIDDSVDNIVSYKSIGPSSCGKLDYAQPHANRSSTPPTSPPILIPPDDSSTSSDAVLPSSSSLPPTPPTVLPLNDTADESANEAPLEYPPTDATLSIPDADLLTNTKQPLSTLTIRKLHADPDNVPDIRPCNTPAPCENRSVFDTLKLHKIFGCRRFRNQQHLTASSANAKLIHTGELPPTLGNFATIPNPPAGKLSRKRRRYLDKVHMDIVFGDCVALGGYRYALILVDVATRYCWIYGMSSLTSNHVISALEAFRADANGVPKKFHSDFDKKLIGGKALKWILNNKSHVITAPAGHQSSNGLVECTWRTVVQMA